MVRHVAQPASLMRVARWWFRTRLATQVGDPHVFQVDRVVLPQERQRRFVVAVGALALDRLLRSAKLAHRLAAPFTALLATRDALGGFRQLLLPASGVAWVLDHQPRGSDKKHLQPNSNASLTSGGGQWLCRHIRAGQDDLPTIRLTRAGNGLGRACHRARDQRAAPQPICASTRKPLSSRAPLPDSMSVKRW
jgi:hypothetical protein